MAVNCASKEPIKVVRVLQLDDSLEFGLVVLCAFTPATKLTLYLI